MHHLDEGSGDPVLLLHGEPTWSFLYRKVIPPLARVARCVAPDYFGFGRSDKPTDRGWYSYDRHSESLARFVEELDLQRITVVVQDWGGPLGFRFAVENPERVARLVVMNTGIGARAPNDEWLRFQAFMRRVDTEIVPGQLVRLSLVQPTTDEVIAGYDAPFPVPESRIGVVQFPELVATGVEHPSAPKMLEVRDATAQPRPPRARALQRRRPDLLAQGGRGDGRAPPPRRAGSAARGRRPLPPGGSGHVDRRADRVLRRVVLTGFIRTLSGSPTGRSDSEGRSSPDTSLVRQLAALPGRTCFGEASRVGGGGRRLCGATAPTST